MIHSQAHSPCVFFFFFLSAFFSSLFISFISSLDKSREGQHKKAHTCHKTLPTNYSQLKGEIHRCTCFFPFFLPSMLASLHFPSLPLLPLYLFRCCGCFTTPYESCLDEGSTSKLPFSHLDCTPECLSKPFTTTMPWESC